MNNSDSANADATAAYWLGLFDAVVDSLQTFEPQSTEGHLVSPPAYPSTAGSTPNFDAVNRTAFTPAPTTSTETFTNIAEQNYIYQNVPSMHASSFTPQLVGDPNWRGVSPLAVSPVAAASNQVVGHSNSASPPTSQSEWAWLFETGQTTYPTPSSLSSGERLVAPGYGASFHGIPTPPAEQGIGGVSWPTSAPSTSADVMNHRKRRHDESYGDEASVAITSNGIPPQKRFKGGEANEILRARTGHKPVARIPKSKINREPKEAGRGAERLATRNSHGIHHRPLLGPSFQQGWAAEPAGAPICVEGSGEAEVARHIDSTVRQQQQQQEEDEAKVLPRKINPEHKALLAATQKDWENGTISAIKCRLCPNTHLEKWDDFRRHCNTTETHPSTIAFCDECGDFFARTDSLKRHMKFRPAECLRVKAEEAQEKRRETLKAHEAFLERLKRFVETGEDIGQPFCEIIKAKFPDSSKKRTAGRRVQSGPEGR